MRVKECSLNVVRRVMYDRSCVFWHLLGSVLRQVSKPRKTMPMYWSAQQRFYRQMLMAAKVRTYAGASAGADIVACQQGTF